MSDKHRVVPGVSTSTSTVPRSLRAAERHRAARMGGPASPSPPAYDLDNIYTYHPPIGDQQQRYAELRASARGHAELVVKLVPASAERTLALRRLEEAVFWSNAAIARNEGRMEE